MERNDKVESIMMFFLCTRFLKKLWRYKAAYDIKAYAYELDDYEEYIYSMLPEGAEVNNFMDQICDIDDDTYLRLTMQRYCWNFRRVVDYVIFYMMKKKLIPDLGTLHLANRIDVPLWDEIRTISFCGDDITYPKFSESYITKLFAYSGWTITKVKSADYIAEYGPLEGEVPTWEDPGGELYWEDMKVEKGEENLNFYIFSSEYHYSTEEMAEIFYGFCSNGYLFIMNEVKVIIAIEDVTFVRGLEIYNNWSEFSPLSALAAWCGYLRKKLIRVRRLEERGNET